MMTAARIRALKLLVKGPFDNAHVPGQRRVSSNVWAALRRDGLVKRTFPFELTEKGRKLVASVANESETGKQSVKK